MTTSKCPEKVLARRYEAFQLFSQNKGYAEIAGSLRVSRRTAVRYVKEMKQANNCVENPNVASERRELNDFF
jgi:hypothetical protein